MLKKPNIKILYTSPIMNYPPIGGPELRIENSIIALSQISHLYIYCQKPIKSDCGFDYFSGLCEEFYYPNFIKLNRLKKTLNYIFSRYNKCVFSQEDYIFDEFLRVIKLIKPDIIWLGYGNISYPLLKRVKEKFNIPIVCDTDSVWSRFILRGIPYVKDGEEIEAIKKMGEQKEEEEKWGTAIADVTTAVSEIDAIYYRKLALNTEQIHIFSNVINLPYYNRKIDMPTQFINPCIYLAGSFWKNSPMEEAARWIIFKILPIVKEKFPDIHFYIIGKGSKECLFDINDPGISILGKVRSVLPYLFHCDVVVVPLKFESGTRYKILEAGACKKPVVSTTLGAEGIYIKNGENILIADDEIKFAEKIIILLQDRIFAQKLGKNLYKLVEEQYDIKNLKTEGEKICEYLMSRNVNSNS